MPCVVCDKDDKNTNYKCPKCFAKYCSVSCFKTHQQEQCSDMLQKEQVEPTTTPKYTANKARPIPEELRNKKPHYVKIFQDSRVQELLDSQGVSKHIKLVANILTDPKLSGEQTAEGRRLVALKKIRELRKGGREANVAIEELAVTVSGLWPDERP